MKSPKQKLDAIINFRIPKVVKAKWQDEAKAANLCLGDFIRASIESGDKTLISNKPTPRKIPKIKRETADPKLIQAIARCGNNLNQIARRVNTQDDAIDIHIELVEIKEQLMSHVS